MSHPSNKHRLKSRTQGGHRLMLWALLLVLSLATGSLAAEQTVEIPYREGTARPLGVESRLNPSFKFTVFKQLEAPSGFLRCLNTTGTPFEVTFSVTLYDRRGFVLTEQDFGGTHIAEPGRELQVSGSFMLRDKVKRSDIHHAVLRYSEEPER